MTIRITSIAFSALAAVALAATAATSASAHQSSRAHTHEPVPTEMIMLDLHGSPAPGGLASPHGGGAAGPRKDKIDLSVCDLATFDFDKCLN